MRNSGRRASWSDIASSPHGPTDSIVQAVGEFQAGHAVFLIDGEHDPSDLRPAQFVALRAEAADEAGVRTLLLLGGGSLYLCVPVERAQQLGLGGVRLRNSLRWQSRLAGTFDAVTCEAGGITPADRARSIAVAIAETVSPRDLRYPGSVAAVVPARDGTLERPGFGEAARDLARLTGGSCAVISEVLNSDGNVATMRAVHERARAHAVQVVGVRDLAFWRAYKEDVLEAVSPVRLPTIYGAFSAVGLHSPADTAPYLALIGGPARATPVVSVHRTCLGAAVMSRACDCGRRLRTAMEQAVAQGGIVIHLPRPEAHNVCFDTSGERSWLPDDAVAALILRKLGVSQVRAPRDSALAARAADLGIEIVSVSEAGQCRA